MFYMEKLNAQKKELLDLKISPSLSDSILNLDASNSTFPSEIIESKEYKKQAQERKAIKETLENIYKKVPDITLSLHEAVQNKLIPEKECAELYSKLTAFLQNTENDRLLLYLPLEFIPENNWSPETKELAQALDEFKKTFFTTWKELLSIHDIRSNFVDGDIPEPELRTKQGLDKVSKAAHLIPLLIQKNLISIDEVLSLAEDTKDTILKNSIFDTLPYLYDLGFISEEIIKRIKTSHDASLQNMGRILESLALEKAIEKKENKSSKNNIGEIESRILLEKQTDGDTTLNAHKLPERIAWEKKRNIEHLIYKYSLDIKEGILKGNFLLKDLLEFSSKDTLYTLIVITGIRDVLTHMRKNLDDTITHDYIAFLHSQKNNPDSDVQEALHNTWAYLEHADYTNFYTENVVPSETKKISSEAKKLEALAHEIEHNEELKESLYPVLIFFGSKIKGYGNSFSDTDIALFIKPKTNIHNQQTVEDTFMKTVGTTLQEQPLEFWLKENKNGLEIIDFPYYDKHLADSSMINVFFNGVWCGDSNAIKELQNKLVATYFYETNMKINELPARKVWLQELERDTLQYRLMHKGYKKLHIPETKVHTEHSQDMDTESMFWDSGYRRLATQLYVEKVFLPHLKK